MIAPRFPEVSLLSSWDHQPACAPQVANHRGPCGEALLPAPAPAEDSATAPAPTRVQATTAQGGAIASGRESHFHRFIKVVESRPASPGDGAKTEKFSIATRLAEHYRLTALAAVAKADEELHRDLDHPPGIAKPATITAEMAEGAPLWQDDDHDRSPVHAGQSSSRSLLGSLPAMRGQPGSRMVAEQDVAPQMPAQPPPLVRLSTREPHIKYKDDGRRVIVQELRSNVEHLKASKHVQE